MIYTVYFSGRPAGELDDRYVTVVDQDGLSILELGSPNTRTEEYLYGGSQEFSSKEEAIEFAEYRAGFNPSAYRK
jgi:hypothetical protein